MANYNERQKLVLEDVQIIFRNFSGKPSDYNREGDRNFTVILPTEELAQRLTEDGWNVKCRPGRDENDPPIYTLSVKVLFHDNPAEAYRDPKCYLVHEDGNLVQLTPETAGTIDNVRIRQCDMTIIPWCWSRNGHSGISAYLEAIYVNIETDPLALKYGNLG